MLFISESIYIYSFAHLFVFFWRIKQQLRNRTPPNTFPLSIGCWHQQDGRFACNEDFNDQFLLAIMLLIVIVIIIRKVCRDAIGKQDNPNNNDNPQFQQIQTVPTTPHWVAYQKGGQISWYTV